MRLGTTSASAPHVLDAAAFPNAALLKNNAVLGRLNVTNRLGDTVLVFNINNPASPMLETCLNNRSLTAGTGDLGPEGLVFIAAADSPTGQPLLVLVNEVSSTVAVYGIQTPTMTATRAG
ncbi:hypothetical protein QMK33_21185 [Hymenobacter sp. H14-R3]|uniref:choice-of-anchor I domain-containing protein n=1 Tax=Hymenobacter sp. H14-R3 TaxID=3046308 RepID=UPI0024BAB546|nr:hypothetical protein [Hymenobacter sp. H14-R3]MDJ0367668.1 hypothetical protein [Hymenobacter sp. H14-R3]